MCRKSVQNLEEIKNTNAILITEESDDIDVLDRKIFIDQILKTIEYYSANKERVSFSIQGSWGSGKSWVINKLTNELYDIQDFENCGSKYCIFSYNAWDYDYYDEPLLSLFISIYKQLNNENAVLIKNEETRKKVKTLLDTIKDDFMEELKIVPFIGNIINFKQSYDEKLEQYDENIRKYDYHFDINQIMEATLKGLNKISESKTIVLFIDELDRCLPEYAIKVFERIHHIKQYVRNIQIIYSIDKNQLEKIIENTFGTTNSISDYLAKFIDFGYKIPPAQFNTAIENKYKELFEQFDFVNCDKSTTIFELIKSLLPESIPIRIQQAMLKKIIFLNNQLNTTKEKMDYSVLITELFIAIAEQTNIKWEGTYFSFNKERQTVEIDNQLVKNQYKHPKEIQDFILRIACTGIYKYYMSKGGQNKMWLIIYPQEATINSLVLYYIARLINDNEYYSFDSINYLQQNDEYLKKFHSYYKALDM